MRRFLRIIGIAGSFIATISLVVSLTFPIFRQESLNNYPWNVLFIIGVLCWFGCWLITKIFGKDSWVRAEVREILKDGAPTDECVKPDEACALDRRLDHVAICRYCQAVLDEARLKNPDA